MLRFIDRDMDLSEIPEAQRRCTPIPLEKFNQQNDDRNTNIVKAYESGGYTLKEIGDYFKLHYTTVSGIIKNHKSKT